MIKVSRINKESKTEVFLCFDTCRLKVIELQSFRCVEMWKTVKRDVFSDSSDCDESITNRYKSKTKVFFGFDTHRWKNINADRDFIKLFREKRQK